MRLLTKVRSAFRVIKSAAIKFVAGLINGTIQIGIANGRFFYENHSQNQDIKILRSGTARAVQRLKAVLLSFPAV